MPRGVRGGLAGNPSLTQRERSRSSALTGTLVVLLRLGVQPGVPARAFTHTVSGRLTVSATLPRHLNRVP